MPFVYRFALPCYIDIDGKKAPLNINWYRNAHYQALAKAKRMYVPDEIEPFKARSIRVYYTFFWPLKRKTDLMNWVSVADKFFLDWLVSMGYIPDDNTAVYPGMSATVCKGGDAPKIVAIVEKIE